MQKTYKIEFTPKSILIVLGVILMIFLFIKLSWVFFTFFFAFILASGLRPLVEKLQRKGVPRALSITLIYILLIGLISFILYLSGSVVADQIKIFSDNIVVIISDTLSKFVEAQPWLKNIFGIKEISDIRPLVQNFFDNDFNKFITGTLFSAESREVLVNVIDNIIGVLFGIFTVFMISAYMLQREDKFYDGIVNMLPENERKKVHYIINRVEEKLGHWTIGQLLLMFFIGLAAYVGTALPGLFIPDFTISKYAIPIALIAGLLEAVPTIGPIITWVAAIIISIGTGGSVPETIYVAILFTLIQQLEAVLIVPMIMKKAIGIDPIISILGIIAASSLFGIAGAILVLPLTAAFQIVVEELVAIKKDEDIVNKKLKT